MENPRRTPLYDKHLEAGARLVSFAGWEMPVSYEGVLAEHKAVRTDSGVFDVSHMGEIEVEGPAALELLQGLLSNDVSRLEHGDAQYTLLTNETGGIIDDLIVVSAPPDGRYSAWSSTPPTWAAASSASRRCTIAGARAHRRIGRLRDVVRGVRAAVQYRARSTG